MYLLITLVIILLLILVNGLYVAAEFSTVSAKRPRLAQMAAEGNTTAASVLGIIEDPKRIDTYVAACQLGITVSSLLLGVLGQSRLMTFLEPFLAGLGAQNQLIAQSISATLILLLLTILQVIFGELMPKNVGLQYPERLAMSTLLPMRWSLKLFQPLIWFFNGSGQIIMRLLGANAVAEHSHVHSPQEIMMLVEESSAGGLLDIEERRLLVNTLQLRHLTARKVMIPRNHMFTASVDQPCGEILKLLATSTYSRLPLYKDSIDEIQGIVHLKDLLRGCHAQPALRDQPVQALMHTAHYVPDSMAVEDVMKQMQQEHDNMVIVVDEYGGTAGMITFEDLIEELIGEFQDEFDHELPPVVLRGTKYLVVQGDVKVDELNELLDLTLPSNSVDTIGGLVTQEVGRMPEKGDWVEFEELKVRVEQMGHHTIDSLRLTISPEQRKRVQKQIS